MEQDLVALHEKLDRLSERVEFLMGEAERAARARAEREELARDLTPIANDAFRLVSQQLEEVQSCADLGHLLRLVKRLLRDSCNLERMLDQLESLVDLAQTAGPLLDSVYEKTARVLERAENKGYFQVGRSSLAVLDEAVALAVTKPSSPPPSLWSLVRRLRDPDVRRGMELVLGVMGAIGKQRVRTVGGGTYAD